MVTPLPPADLIAQWPVIGPLIEGWVERELSNEFTAHDLLREACEGKRDFWLVFNLKPGGGIDIRGLCSSYIFTTPRKKIWFCHIAFGAEDGTGWLDEINPVFKREAARAGCDCLQMVGRRGFGRVLEKYGAKQIATIFEYRLTEEDRRGTEQTGHQYQPDAEHEPDHQRESVQ